MVFHVPLPKESIHCYSRYTQRLKSMKSAYKDKQPTWNAQEPKTWLLLRIHHDETGKYPNHDPTGVALTKDDVSCLLRHKPENFPEVNATTTHPKGFGRTINSRFWRLPFNFHQDGALRFQPGIVLADYQA
jgi:hypothetical protein